MKSQLAMLRKALCALIPLLAAGLVSVQAGAQDLKDAFVATPTDLLKVGATGLEPRLEGERGTDFSALAIEMPAPGQARHLIAANGATLEFFAEDVDAAGDAVARLVSSIDLSSEEPGLSSITALAATDYGTLLVAGYVKKRRWFELWEIDPYAEPGPTFALKLVDHPQLTDMVYVRASDIPAGSAPLEEGLLAAAGKEILLFPKAVDFSSIVPLLDVRGVPELKNNTQLLSVDLVRETPHLVIATSTRQLLVWSPTGLPGPRLFDIPGIADRNCDALRDQRFVVRNARAGADGSMYVSDACGQLLQLDFTDLYADANGLLSNPVALIHDEGLVALAVGEGKIVVCEAGAECELAPGFIAVHAEPAVLLVLQYELCDPRVSGAACDDGFVNTPANPGVVRDDFALNVKKILPTEADADLLGEGEVWISGQMYASGARGLFGLLYVSPQAAWNQEEIESTLQEGLLGLPTDLTVELDDVLPRGTSIVRLLNQAQVGYAPDGNEPPTVNDYTTPVVVGQGSTRTTTRGYSVLAYGVQLGPRPGLGYSADGRVPGRCDSAADDGCRQLGGIAEIPESAEDSEVRDYLESGVQRLCNLDVNGYVYEAVDDYRYYFVNLAACLFSDLESLLKSTDLIPDAAFGSIHLRNELIDRLDNAEDKLIKGLNTVGSSQGAQNLGAVLSQMQNFDALVDDLELWDVDGESYQVYENELGARSEAFQFNLRHRTIPSIPDGGIPD